MRTQTIIQIERKVRDKVKEKLLKEFQTLHTMIVDKIESDPEFIEAESSRNNMVSIHNLPYVNSNRYSSLENNLNLRIVFTYKHFDSSKFSGNIDFNTYFDEEEKNKITDYMAYRKKIMDIYDEFLNVLYNSKTVKEFRNKINIEEILMKIDKIER